MVAIASPEEYLQSHLLRDVFEGGDNTPTELEAHLERASDWLEDQCKQSLRLISETEQYVVPSMHAAVDTKGTLVITPRFFPVRTISSIKYRLTPTTAWADATVIPASNYSAEDFGTANYSYGPTIYVPYVGIQRGAPWAEVQIVFTYGYTTLPESVKEAVILIAYSLLTVGFSAVDAQGNAVRSLMPSWAWDKYIQPTINQYQRRF